MAGKVTVSTINDDTGVLATQNGMTGIAKAWIQYNGSTQTIIGSFNVSSVTYNAAGDYTVNFTTAMPNTNYSIVCINTQSSGNAPVNVCKNTNRTDTTGLFNIVNCQSTTRFDAAFVSAAVFSS